MDIVEPKFMKENYGYYDNEGLKIKDDAPEWAKQEYKEFMEMIK